MEFIFFIIAIFLFILYNEDRQFRTIIKSVFGIIILLVIGSLVLKTIEEKQPKYQSYDSSTRGAFGYQSIYRQQNSYRCSELTSKQARDLFNRGHTYLDRDNDGYPCEY